MTKKPTPAAVGLRFVVTEPAPFRVGNKLIAKYSPEYGPYTVTDLNCDFVGALMAEGKAVAIGIAKGHKAGGKAFTG